MDEWTSILKLAVKWNFQSIEVVAVKQLGPITSPIDKIVLGRTYNIVEWLPTAYGDICRRKDALTLEEGMRLGMEDVIKITTMRQGGNSPNFSTTEQDALERTFGLLSRTVIPYLDGEDTTQTRETSGLKLADAVGTRPLPERKPWESGFEGGSQDLYDEEDSDNAIETCTIWDRERGGDHLCPFCGLHDCVCPTTKSDEDDGYCKLCGEEGLCRTCPFCGRYDCVCACWTANRHNSGIDISSQSTAVSSCSTVCTKDRCAISVPAKKGKRKV
jgi:hypothetical protein